MAFVMCSIASFFSYARAQRVLGTNAGNAPVIADTISANIVDGTANYFKIAAANLPATIYYWPDTAFGPLPTLINEAGTDTVPAQMVVEGCRMGWRWQLAAAASEQEVRCLYFSAHENATAEIRPYVCYSTGSDTVATACTSFTWNGKTYTQSGNYADTTKNAAGCDSIVTLYLTINQSTQSEETETACDSLEWNGKWYKESGDYTYKTTNAAGCDSTATLHLTVYSSYHLTLKDTASCEEYQWGDTTIVTSGTYTRAFKAVSGCDSIVTQKVVINKDVYTSDYVTAYDSYTWIDGKTYTSSIAQVVWSQPTAAGCDSVVFLNLTIKHLKKDTVPMSFCANKLPYAWRGMTLTESGLFTTDTLKSTTTDTDTLHTLALTVNPTYAVDTIADLCGTSFDWRGKTYTESGAYPFSGTTVAGCDSIVTLRLTLRKPTTGDTTATAYEPFVWHGTTYAESGTYTYRTTNVAGCDSTVTLHLTVSERPVYDTVIVYYCPKSGIEEHIDATSNPMLWYKPYDYEKPSKEWYMEGVVTDEKNDGANVNFLKAEQNLHEHYEGEEQLTPVTTIYWRYRERGASSQTEVVINRTQPQWVERGTISIEVQFQCGQRFYDSFTVGDMTEDMEQVSGEEQAIKRMENGQVVIIRNGAKYTILGTKIQ